MKSKKFIYTLGAIITIGLPGIAIVSCGNENKTIDTSAAQSALDQYLDTAKFRWSGTNKYGTFAPINWTISHTYLEYQNYSERGQGDLTTTPPTDLSNGDVLTIIVSLRDGYSFVNNERVFIMITIPDNTFN